MSSAVPMTSVSLWPVPAGAAAASEPVESDAVLWSAVEAAVLEEPHAVRTDSAMTRHRSSASVFFIFFFFVLCT